MGPNALKMVEELTLNLDLHPGMRVLDLGCGKGLTSIFLAKEYGVQVYATDLWITATENYNRFKQLCIDNQIIPIHADANDLPYADEYFDENDTFMDAKLAPLIKPNGIIALAFPGFKKDIHDQLPPEFLLSWTAEDLETFHSCERWRSLFSK
jgi:SAM-dependent methyltransferase